MTRDVTLSATWTSATTSVATINSNGKVNTVALGTSTITAASSGVEARVTMLVTAGPITVSILH